MARRTRFTGIARGNSILRGYNYGIYPDHHFKQVNDPEGVYPLWCSCCGVDKWHSSCYRERKNSDTFAVEYVREGTFIFQQNNTVMRAKEGDIFFVHLGADCSMRCETKLAEKKTVIIQGPLLQQTIEALGLDRIDMISSPDHSRVEHYFDTLYELNDTSGSRRRSSVLCYALLVELTEMATIGQRPPELQKAVDYIHAHLTSPLSLQELLRHCGTSRATLHRQFQKYMQTSPINYYLDQKLERAKILLQSRPCSVKEVAEILHYASPQYFASEFKKKYGASPKAYKCRVI